MRKFIIRTFGKPLLRFILGCTLAVTILGSAFAATQLEIQSVPMLKLTGDVGTTNQIQYVTEVGQTNAWNVLTNIVLTNSTQFYVDTSATGSIKRFYQTVDLSGTNAKVPSGMALIPAGSFTMGDTFSEGWPDEVPTHTVNVAAFYMDKYLVTKELWDEVYNWAKTHGYTFDNAGSNKAPNHPVETVSWYDVVKWCNARSEKEGLVPAYNATSNQPAIYRTGRVNIKNAWVKWDSGYRLPTEAEWEKAARGGLSGNRFPWGNTITHSQANYFSTSSYSYDISTTSGYHPIYQIGGEPYTNPVGAFAPNGYGLYDMAGNVWEWCWDWQGAYGNASQTDPRGPDLGTGRVVRGGSGSYSALACRVAGREDGIPPGNAGFGAGFRAVLPVGQ